MSGARMSRSTEACATFSTHSSPLMVVSVSSSRVLEMGPPA
ncbi:unnamed protein product, partial [Plutella xylostella]